MIVTIICVIYAVLKNRRERKYETEAEVQKVFKENENHCSIIFYPTDLFFCQAWQNSGGKDTQTLINRFCVSDKDIAEIRLNREFENKNIRVCTVYPQQKLDLSCWMKYPSGFSLFPLDILSNDFQTSTKSDDNNPIYIVIETNISNYQKDTLEHCTKIENYGRIKAWSVLNKLYLNLLLETDIDHITRFVSMVIQGQRFINNCLFVTHIKSVTLKGKPCFYDRDITICHPTRNKESIISFGESAIAAGNQRSLVAIRYYPNVYMYPRIVRETVKRFLPEKCPEDGNRKKIDQALSLTIMPANIKQTLSRYRMYNEFQPFDDDWSKFDDCYENTDDCYEGVFDYWLENTAMKPSNVLVYANTEQGKKFKTVLSDEVLHPRRYIIHDITSEVIPKGTWMQQVALIVVCGDVTPHMAQRFIDYSARGGKVLALSSNIMNTLLLTDTPKLAHLSSGDEKGVSMMPNLPCYSKDASKSIKFPIKFSLKNKRRLSILNLDILKNGMWNLPDILLATFLDGGKIMFSHGNLEANPTKCKDNGELFKTVESNAACLEVIRNLLKEHLEIEINNSKESIKYTPAYLLSRNKNFKKWFVETLAGNTDNTLQMLDLKMKFYTSEEIQETASENFLPIIMNDNVRPTKFSSENFYQNLVAKQIGRLVIYSDVLTSTMNAMDACMIHGLAVITRQQTKGRGRFSSVWLSPDNSATFTLQIHVPRTAILSKQLSLLQSIVAVAMVSAVRSIPGYEKLDIRIKWPNDIYVGRLVKIGSVVVHTQKEIMKNGNNEAIICNITAGINLSNPTPTTCINEVIKLYNSKRKENLEELSLEKYVAFVFNRLENLIYHIERHDKNYFYNLYYKYWLHRNASVTIVEPTGEYQEAKILSIDDFGHLVVTILIYGCEANITIHPDNSYFDSRNKLIIMA